VLWQIQEKEGWKEMNIYMKDDGEEGIIDDNGRMISFEDLAKASRLFEMLKISDGKYCDNCRMLFGIQCYLFRKDGYVPSGESCLEDIESEYKNGETHLKYKRCQKCIDLFGCKEKDGE